jgi:dynein heavy chain, axonemal
MKNVAEKKLVIAKENEEAEAVKKVVSVEEDKAAVEAAEVKAVKDEADADLAVALPALDDAVKKVKGIDVNNFYELKGVAAPGMSIVKCFETVMQFFPKKGKAKKNSNKDPKTMAIDPDGWWDLSKKELLSNPKQFLQDLINYDKDNIPDDLILRVKPMMEHEAMSEAKIKNASVALVAVRIWCNAMIVYHEVLKIVNPKRALAAEKTIQLEKVMKSLNEKRAQVKAINDKLAMFAAEI